ncbi:MAG TPA: 30S ribosomal protein S6 [Dehalococcoidia bacterium]|nr:30S ribosomal protein S6 [Dehalococcoidia bacterium]
MATSKSKKEEIKTEEQPLRDYELVLVINPEVAEGTLEAAVNNVNQFITGKGGVISDKEQWGKRKLAFPIKRHLEGNYVLTRCKMKPAWARELDATLNISEDILRHLLIKVGS